MLGRLLHRSNGLPTSKLFDQRTFYPALLDDLRFCKKEAIIESPFITSRRVTKLFPIFQELRRRGVRIIINTREPQEHDEQMYCEAEKAVTALQSLGVKVLYTGGHHRKLVILDRRILYEGSLNVLSQNESCEVMRRINSNPLAEQMLNFTGITKFL